MNNLKIDIRQNNVRGNKDHFFDKQLSLISIKGVNQIASAILRAEY